MFSKNDSVSWKEYMGRVIDIVKHNGGEFVRVDFPDFSQALWLESGDIKLASRRSANTDITVSGEWEGFGNYSVANGQSDNPDCHISGHSFTTYVGLVESYQYCEKCGEKESDILIGKLDFKPERIWWEN